MLPFTKEEYQERVQKVKSTMAEKGMDVLFLVEPANMNWVSGYDAMSFYVPQGVVVSLDEEMPYWIGRFQDQYSAHVTTWLDDEHIRPYADKYLWEPKVVHVMDFVADFIKEKRWQAKTIGVEKDAHYFTAHWFERLTAALPDAKFTDATNMVTFLRAVKSKQELDYMGIAARIVEKAMGNAIHMMEPGVRENAVGAQILYDQAMGTGAFGGEYIALNPIIPSGDRTAAAHLTWKTEGCYENNQLVYIEIAGCYRRYHAPLARTIFIGDPPKIVSDTAKVCVEGINAAMEAAKPGVTCEEVERVWQTTINKYGLEKESRMGYAVGIGYPPVWMENTSLCFKPGEKTVLQPNMTFHMMPGLWLEGYGVAITECIRITDRGAETITKFPRQLFVK